MELNINEVITYFVQAKVRDFFARVIGSLQRIAAPGLGTMAVGIGPDGRFRLYYDPAYVARTPLKKLHLVIMHEFIHIIDDHLIRYILMLSTVVSEEERTQFRSVMNIAADLADNETMRTEKNFDESDTAKAFFFKSEQNPDSFIIPEDFNYPRNLPFEAYQMLLVQRRKEFEKKLQKLLQQLVKAAGQVGDGEPGEGQAPGQQPGGAPGHGGGSGDEGGAPGSAADQYFKQRAGRSHEHWDSELKGRNPEEMQGIADRAQQDARNLVRTAYEEWQRDEDQPGNKSRGTLPAWLQERIEVFLTAPKIPWPQVLRDLVIRTRQTKLARGMARPNRRMYGVPDILPFPGRARDSRFTIWFALDTSGSMGTDELRLGLEELIHIVQMEPEVQLVVLYCDADLHQVYDVTSMDQIDFAIKGRGGTDFNPPFVLLREMFGSDRAPDVLVYATDGYAPAPEPENRVPIPVIWLLTPNGAECSPDYGIHLRMVDQ